jgi:hypothetical protein
MPLWLNEGLAMSSEPDQGATRVVGYQRATAAGTALPIEEIVRLRAYPQDGASMDSYYAGAAALTRFLILQGGRDKLFEFARRAAAIGFDAALREGFAGFYDVDATLAGFGSWLQNQ